jgi:hypothetical protein
MWAAEEPAAWRSYGRGCVAFEQDGDRFLRPASVTAHERLSKLIERYETRVEAPVWLAQPNGALTP